MRVLITACLLLLLSDPAWAAKKTTVVDANEVVTISEVTRTGSNRNDKYEACANIYGSFGGGTYTLKVSTDAGTTKSAVKHYSEGVLTDFSTTAATNLCWEWGWSSQSDDGTIFYISSSGATTPTVTVDVLDNQ